LIEKGEKMKIKYVLLFFGFLYTGLIVSAAQEKRKVNITSTSKSYVFFVDVPQWQYVSFGIPCLGAQCYLYGPAQKVSSTNGTQKIEAEVDIASLAKLEEKQSTSKKFFELRLWAYDYNQTAEDEGYRGKKQGEKKVKIIIDENMLRTPVIDIVMDYSRLPFRGFSIKSPTPGITIK
jgi:hypothetical protein